VTKTSPWHVNLLCLDKTEYFETTLWSTKAFLSTFEALDGKGAVKVNRSLASMDPEEITEVIYEPADVLHIMSHAESGGTATGRRKVFGIFPVSTAFDPELITEYSAELGQLPPIECLLLDACESGSAEWVRKLRPIVAPGKKLILIGSTREVEIEETLVYTMAFYQALIQKSRPKTVAARQNGYSLAHETASQAFKQVRKSKCPFVLKVIVGK